MYTPKKVAIIGAATPHYEQVCPHWSGLLEGFKENGVEAVLVDSRGNEFWSQDVIKSDADVVIFGLLSAVTDTKARTRIREKLPSATTVFWYGDARTADTGQITCDISKEIDILVQSNDGLKLFTQEKFGIIPQYLPLACNVKNAPLVKEKYRIPFLFIGAKIFNKGFEERALLIDTLEKYHQLKVINASHDPLRSKIYSEMHGLYSSASATLDISHFWDIPKYTSNRFWVIPAYWGFPLTKRFVGCEELYPSSARVYWDSKDELVEKLQYYALHETERMDFIRKGWEHTRENHTYAHRVRRLFEIINGGVRVSRKPHNVEIAP